jgi:hypothetical protein
MMRHPTPVIEKIVDAEVVCSSHQLSASVDAEWLDDMILVGRMYVGETPTEHIQICREIEADRAYYRLLKRLTTRNLRCQ